MLKAIAQSIGAWTLLACGILLVAAALLCPLQREVGTMRRQLALMHEQASQLAAQEAGYRRFYLALSTDDPAVLERLAYYQLRLKPAGTQPMVLAAGRSPYTVMAFADDSAMSGQPARDSLPTVESLLQQPLPSARAYLGVNAGPRSRLDRLTIGRKRLALLGVGVLCLCAAMIPVGAHERRQQRMRDVPVKVRKRAA